jgi:hypothetical protein
MPLSRVAAATFAALTLAPFGGGRALAAEPRPDAAPDGWGVAVQAGPATDDAEDSVGLARGEHDDCGLVPLFARNAVTHGPRTGDPEKDSLGLPVTGQYDSCAGTIR